MGQAAKIVVTEISNRAMALKGNCKPRKHKGHYLGNLNAFTQSPIVEGRTPTAVKSRTLVEMQAVSSLADDAVYQPLPTDNSAFDTRCDTYTQALRRSNIAVVMFVVLATGLEVSSVWPSIKPRAPTQSSLDAETTLHSIAAPAHTTFPRPLHQALMPWSKN